MLILIIVDNLFPVSYYKKDKYSNFPTNVNTNSNSDIENNRPTYMARRGAHKDLVLPLNKNTGKRFVSSNTDQFEDSYNFRQIANSNEKKKIADKLKLAQLLI